MVIKEKITQEDITSINMQLTNTGTANFIKLIKL